jgi:small subunit ribosomal protein S1
MPDKTNDESTFADLMKEVSVEEHLLRPGQKVKATIVAITPEGIFLDAGGKMEGYLDRREVEDESGHLTVSEGDSLEVFFVSQREDQKIFTLHISEGEMARIYLQEAWRNNTPVDGLVEREVKGGFSVQIVDGIRGFCPFSQMGLHRIENPGEYIGQRLSFLIKEFSERGRNIVLSNRAVLKEEMRKRKEWLKKTLQEGMTVHGRVTAIQDFGAFVDIDGVHGLLPASEVGWERVKDVREILSVGQELDLVVLRLDWKKNRIALSLKKTLPDPWENIETKYPEGSRHMGKVTSLTDFGAFISLERGVEGLIHISNLGKKVKHPGEILAEDQILEVQVEKVDREKRRISLLPAGVEAPGEKKEKAKGKARRKKEEEKKSSGFGSLGGILKGELEHLKEKK